MRLWSIHPKHLDRIGLIALWRESLLAQKVLHNETKGYKNHPQLDRFKEHPNPLTAIHSYLQVIAEEAKSRGYNFDITKIRSEPCTDLIPITDRQLLYETNHLRSKIQSRSPKELGRLIKVTHHPLFTLVPGEIAHWEKV